MQPFQPFLLGLFCPFGLDQEGRESIDAGLEGSLAELLQVDHFFPSFFCFSLLPFQKISFLHCLGLIVEFWLEGALFVYFFLFLLYHPLQPIILFPHVAEQPVEDILFEIGLILHYIFGVFA